MAAARLPIPILCEDEAFVAVNKPAGVLTIADRQGGESVRDLLADARPDLADLRIVHRLDRDTSGVLLLARTADAHRALCRQFGERTVDKDYLAIIRGEPADDRGMIDLRLGPHPAGDPRMVVSVNGKRAMTEWSVVERFGVASLLRCRLLTGRQHQIRVHLSYIGLPLLVDELYGLAAAFLLSSVKPGYRASGRHEERPLIARLTLHAESVEFTHPTGGGRVRVTADLPKDFRVTLAQLRKLKGRRQRSEGT